MNKVGYLDYKTDFTTYSTRIRLYTFTDKSAFIESYITLYYAKIN